MTKQEFDAITKENWGYRGMASDERRHYRQRRLRDVGGIESFIEIRARERLNYLPTLAIGQKWRNVAEYRLRHHLPLLANMRDTRTAGEARYWLDI